LTAAHCVVDVPRSKLSVGFGEQSLSSNNVRITPERVFVHPGYGGPEGPHDLALLRFRNRPPNSTKSVLGVDSPGVGLEVWLVGHGERKRRPSECVLEGQNCPAPSEILLRAKTQTIGRTQCQNTHRNVHVRQFCVRDVDPWKQGACGLDGGAPLYRMNGRVAGIASYTVSNCRPNKPQVYTDVAQYQGWIKSVSGL
ncbi:MAG: trypsin-like serine protease, partial [Myxococcota bacterium]